VYGFSGWMTTNQEKLASLIERAGITRTEAAKYIAEETKRPCSWRSVQSWLADPSLASARGCPDWAITNLETRLRRLKLSNLSPAFRLVDLGGEGFASPPLRTLKPHPSGRGGACSGLKAGVSNR